jgi:hypothetical protein
MPIPKVIFVQTAARENSVFSTCDLDMLLYDADQEEEEELDFILSSKNSSTTLDCKTTTNSVRGKKSSPSGANVSWDSHRH